MLWLCITQQRHTSFSSIYASSPSHRRTNRVTSLPNSTRCAEHDLLCCRGHSRIWRGPSHLPKLAGKGSGIAPGELAPQLSGMNIALPRAELTGPSRPQCPPVCSASAALLSVGSIPPGEEQSLADMRSNLHLMFGASHEVSTEDLLSVRDVSVIHSHNDRLPPQSRSVRFTSQPNLRVWLKRLLVLDTAPVVLHTLFCLTTGACRVCLMHYCH